MIIPRQKNKRVDEGPKPSEHPCDKTDMEDGPSIFQIRARLNPPVAKEETELQSQKRPDADPNFLQDHLHQWRPRGETRRSHYISTSVATPRKRRIARWMGERGAREERSPGFKAP